MAPALSAAPTDVTTQAPPEATQVPSQAIDTANEAISSVTETTGQVLATATQPVAQAVDTVQEVVSPVTTKAKEVVREATKTPAQALEPVQEVVSPVTTKAKEVVREATETPTQRARPASDEPATAGTPEIGTASAKTVSAADSDKRPAVARSTARADDSVRTTQLRATGIETKPAKGNGAPASVNPASAAGGPEVKTNVTRQVRGTKLRSAQGRTVHRGRALVPAPASRPHADLAARQSAPAPGVRPPSFQNDENGGFFSFSLPGFSWPSFLPPPHVLAQWLLYAATALLMCIAVLLASGFWARQRVLKF